MKIYRAKHVIVDIFILRNVVGQCYHVSLPPSSFQATLPIIIHASPHRGEYTPLRMQNQDHLFDFDTHLDYSTKWLSAHSSHDQPSAPSSSAMTCEGARALYPNLESMSGKITEATGGGVNFSTKYVRVAQQSHVSVGHFATAHEEEGENPLCSFMIYP